MIGKLLTKVFGSTNERALKQIRPLVSRINEQEASLLPLDDAQLAAKTVSFKERLANLAPEEAEPKSKPGPRLAGVPFELLSEHAETYELKVGAKPFTDRGYVVLQLAEELEGLTAIRFSHDDAKAGRLAPIRFKTEIPVKVLIGYFDESRNIRAQPPNLDIDSQAARHDGVETVMRNVMQLESSPAVKLHAFTYGGIGLMTLGMMTRVALGHTGRNVFDPPRSLGVLFTLLAVGALARVAGPLLWPAWTAAWMGASQFLWIAAFAGFVWIYAPMLVKPRIDGRDTRTVRPINCRVGVLPRTHGSALFTRGETQALAIGYLVIVVPSLPLLMIGMAGGAVELLLVDAMAGCAVVFKRRCRRMVSVSDLVRVIAAVAGCAVIVGSHLYEGFHRVTGCAVIFQIIGHIMVHGCTAVEGLPGMAGCAVEFAAHRIDALVTGCTVAGGCRGRIVMQGIDRRFPGRLMANGAVVGDCIRASVAIDAGGRLGVVARMVSLPDIRAMAC